jgi:hypothetical protein
MFPVTAWLSNDQALAVRHQLKDQADDNRPGTFSIHAPHEVGEYARLLAHQLRIPAAFGTKSAPRATLATGMA